MGSGITPPPGYQGGTGQTNQMGAEGYYDWAGRWIQPKQFDADQLAGFQTQRDEVTGLAQSALAGLQGRIGDLEGQEAGIRGAESGAIQTLRSDAARSMFGAAGGMGGLASSGAVRASLGQTGFDRAQREYGIRQGAAEKIQGIAAERRGLTDEIRQQELLTDAGYQGRKAADEFWRSMVDTYRDANQGDRQSRKQAAAAILNEAYNSQWPEVHQKAQDLARHLLQADD